MEAWKAIVGNLAGFCTPAFYIACRPTIIQFFPEVARSGRRSTDYSSRLEDSHASRQYTREAKRVKTLDSSPNLSVQQLPSGQRTKNMVQTLYNRFIYRSRYLFSFKPSSHFPVIPVEMSERNDLSGHAIFSTVFRLPRFGFSWSSIPWESEICWWKNKVVLELNQFERGHLKVAKCESEDTRYLLPLSAIICKLRNILPVLENPQTHYRVLLSRNLRDATHYP